MGTIQVCMERYLATSLPCNHVDNFQTQQLSTFDLLYNKQSHSKQRQNLFVFKSLDCPPLDLESHLDFCSSGKVCFQVGFKCAGRVGWHG